MMIPTRARRSRISNTSRQSLLGRRYYLKTKIHYLRPQEGRYFLSLFSYPTSILYLDSFGSFWMLNLLHLMLFVLRAGLLYLH